MFLFFFFFSSRRRHTRSKRDWSSDVCSSDLWLKAGQYAAARLAHVEAIGHFERALAALAVLPQDQTRNRTEVELQLARGLSLFTVEGFISAEAASAYARARDLAEELGNPRQQFIAVYGLWQSANG